MAEYVEKSIIFPALNKAMSENGALGMTDVEDIIDDLPTADVQSVKRGHWEERVGYGGWGDTYYHCSVCGSDWVLEDGTPKANEWDYCPHCGADMIEPKTTKG